jgi:hypothetical protein
MVDATEETIASRRAGYRPPAGLNEIEIEPVFRQIKYQEVPVWSHTRGMATIRDKMGHCCFEAGNNGVP